MFLKHFLELPLIQSSFRPLHSDSYVKVQVARAVSSSMPGLSNHGCRRLRARDRVQGA